jgi:putative transposase
VVTPTQQRAAADYLIETFDVSERHAGRLLGCHRSTLRYEPQPRSDEPKLIRAILKLARRHRRFGYKRIHAILVNQKGWEVNIKRVHRLWQSLGLRLRKARKSQRKSRAKGTSANSCVNQPAKYRNDVWTYDFVQDWLVDGSSLKWLTRVDEYTRECLTIRVSSRMQGADVRRVLAHVIGQHGAPRRIRSDNGSEFICEALQGWLPSRGTESLLVAPGSPWENESFNSRLRDEFLNGEEFESVADAKAKASWWRREYNRVRPHSSLGYRTPHEFRAECERGRHGQPPQAKTTKKAK